MLLNVGIDVLIGAVPLLGDIFDIGWRSNSRNAALLARWLEQPHQTVRQSRALLLGLLLLPLVAGGAAIGMTLWLLARLLRS